MISARFALYYGVYFTIIAFYLPFFPSWLASSGLQAEDIALVLSAALWGKLAVSPLLAWAADSSDRRRMVLIVTGLALLSFLFLLKWVSGFWALLIVWGFAGAFMTAVIPLTDSLASMAVSQDRMDYGKVRLWGSVSFILVSFSAGHFLEGLDGDRVLYFLMGATFLLLVTGFALPDYRLADRGAPSQHAVKVKAIDALKAIMDRPMLIAGILTASLLQGSHAALYGLASFHWASIGLQQGDIGQLWATGVLVEVSIFFFGGALLVRLGPVNLLGLAVIGGLVRWSLMGAETDMLSLSLLQALHALTFAATHLAAVAFIREQAPPHLISSAQGLYDSLGMGLFIGLAMMMAGWLYEGYGASAAFQAMAVLSALAGLGVMIIKRSQLAKT